MPATKKEKKDILKNRKADIKKIFQKYKGKKPCMKIFFSEDGRILINLCTMETDTENDFKFAKTDYKFCENLESNQDFEQQHKTLMAKNN